VADKSAMEAQTDYEFEWENEMRDARKEWKK